MRVLLGRRRTSFERELRELHAEPRPEFVDALLFQLGAAPTSVAEPPREARFRLGIAATATAVLAAALLALGAPGYVKAACFSVYHTTASAWHETAYGFSHHDSRRRRRQQQRWQQRWRRKRRLQ